MAYIRPPQFVQRVFNPLAMRLGLSGTATLSLAKRKSGARQLVPVIPVHHDGELFIVSTRGESEWVRNLRSAGSAELSRKNRSAHVHANEVPIAERQPIIDAYRQKAGKMVDRYFTVLPDPADHPIFRLETTQH